MCRESSRASRPSASLRTAISTVSGSQKPSGEQPALLLGPRSDGAPQEVGDVVHLVAQSEFAQLASLDKDHLYRELRDPPVSMGQAMGVSEKHGNLRSRTA